MDEFIVDETIETVDEISEENIEIEESIEDKIFGYKMEIEQMNRMIQENQRQISLNNDVVARERMIKILQHEIENKEREIAQLHE